MISQKGLKKDTVLKKYVLGAHPIIHYYMERMRLCQTIGDYMPHDMRLKLSIEKTLTVLIHNILTAQTPMYEIAGWLKPIDINNIGIDEADMEHIDDSRVGRALEKFYEGRHKDVFFRLALRAIKLFEIDCNQIHQDTTSITFAGKYETWHMSPTATYGKNKDHRPDLKQLVLGMSVTADGAVPLVHQIYDGNQTDDRLHPENHQKLRKLLKRADFIYVADCKLATDDNLTKISSCGGKFISVMPRTWKEDERFRIKVRSGKIEWSHLLSRPNNRNPKSKKDHYYFAKGDYKTAKGYRLIWILSKQKAEQDAQTRQRHIEKSIEELKELQTRINTYNLKTRKNIREKITSLLKGNQCINFIDFEIHSKTYHKKQYKGVGRPNPNSSSKLVPVKSFSINFEINIENVVEESKTDGVFPLITNLSDEKPKKVLEIYKYQPFLEKRHSQLKTYQLTTPAFLKKSERVIAYLHMHVMALMVSTIVERQLRTAMRNKSIKSLLIYPEDKPCPTPTMYDIVRLFKGVERFEVIQSEQVNIFPAQLNDIQKKVLDLLEVPKSLYQ